MKKLKVPKLPRIKLPRSKKVRKIGGGAGKRLRPPVLPKRPPAGQMQRKQAPAGALPPAPKGLPAPNTTYDFYISPNDAPAAPDQQNIRCHRDPDFAMGAEHSEGNQNFRWTHITYVQQTEDIRDTWPSNPANKVYIPDKTATPFLVVFVEVLNRNTPNQYKRVFLKRQTVTWPSDNI